MREPNPSESARPINFIAFVVCFNGLLMRELNPRYEVKRFKSLSLCKDVPRFIEILKAQDAHEPINMTRSNLTGLTNVMGIELAN
jgi:hypothetical protein